MGKHIYGKVYDLTQASMNTIIDQLDAEQERNRILTFHLKEVEARLLVVGKMLVDLGLEKSSVFDELDDVLAMLYNINKREQK